MGELISLFKDAEVLHLRPSSEAVVAPVEVELYNTEPVGHSITSGIVAALDRLIHRKRIDERQACELLDEYLENGNTEFIVNMQESIISPVEPDPNQLSLFD